MKERSLSDTENQSKSTNRARIFGKLWLTVIQLFGLLLIIPWLFQYAYPYLKYRSLGNTTMIFEFFEVIFEPMTRGPLSIALIIKIIVYYPLIAIFFFILAWILYEKRQYVWAAITATIPMCLYVPFIIL